MHDVAPWSAYSQTEMEHAVGVEPARTRDRRHASDGLATLARPLIREHGDDAMHSPLLAKPEELARRTLHPRHPGERQHGLELPERVDASTRLIEE